MAKKTTLGSSSAQYTRSYSGFRGVDLSSDPSLVNAARPSYLINMYRDYDSEHGAAIETIPGYRRLFHFDGKIHGIWGYSSSQDDKAVRYIVVHAGTKIYTFPFEERDLGVCEERFDKLEDADSGAFLQNNNFYICDGKGIYVMKADLSVVSLEEDAYVPITYLHGAPYEQRNMLTDRFVNRDTALVSGDFIGEGLPLVWNDGGEYRTLELSEFGLDYETVYINGGAVFYAKGYEGNNTDELNVSTFESGIEENDDGDSFTYRVTVDAEYLEDGRYRRIILHEDTLTEAQKQALKDRGVVEIWAAEDLEGYHLCDVRICDPCVEITSVKVAGKEIPAFKDAMEEGERPPICYMPVRERMKVEGEDVWYYSYLHVLSLEKSDLDAQEVDISGIADGVKMQTAGDVQKSTHTDYMVANTEYEGTAKQAILNCGIATTFDGRVFLTGNPKLPNTVFYSCRDLTGYNNPAYFGVYNYFNDGEGNEPNVALLSTSGVLMVLKRNTLQGSAIYYHTGADGLDDVVPRIYPSVPGVAGLGCEGAALNFLDDAVFISERGLEGLSKEQLNLERTIGHRSSNVDRLLRECDLQKARMCRWGGYLCVFDGEGRIFLADSRQLFQGIDGAAEYEWYLLEGIGSFGEDSLRYRTITQYPLLWIEGIPEGVTLEGATISGEPLSVAAASEFVEYGEIYTVDATLTVDGVSYLVPVKYIEREEEKILCDTDGERYGGKFSPSRIGFSMGGVLFFGTEDGTICCFNTDKRGVSVNDEAVESDTIHRSFYSFAGHRYLSGLALRSDNCGVPHLTKRTVRKTCVIKLKTMRGASVSVKIRTDREPWHEVMTSFAGTDFSFFDMEFDNFSFSQESDTIVTVKDKEKKWVEKQFYLYSDGYMRPFGLHGLTFNYEMQGRVKKG